MRWAVLLWFFQVFGCSEPVTTHVQHAPVDAVSATDAPDLALLLVTGLRAGDDGAADAFWAAVGQPELQRFGQAYAQASGPFTSLGSLLTGRYVGAIPMCGQLLTGDRSGNRDQQAWCAKIPPNRPTLAEVLGIYGYESALFTVDLPGSEALSRGFDRHQSLDEWAEGTAAAGEWWRASGDKPRLLVLVLGDAGGDILGQDALPRFPEQKLQWLEGVHPDISQVSFDPETVRAAYRKGAAGAGALLGKALKVVQGESRRDSWSFVGSLGGVNLTSRSGFSGSPVPLLTDNLLLDRTVHVPLALFGSRTLDVSAQAAGLVELVDLFPTLMSMAGAVAPAGLAGSDLRKASPEEAIAYAEFGDMLFLRRGRRAITFRCTLHNATSLDPGITSRLLDDQAALGPELYALHDVVTDPMQRHELRGEQPAVFDAMRKRLISLRTGAAAIPKGEVSPERLWQLRMAPSDGYW